MAATLYGAHIPDGAVTVVIRPLAGSGRRRNLHAGSLYEGDRLLSEDDLGDLIAADDRVWMYIAAAQEDGTLPAAETPGRLECRVSLQFCDQTGSPIVVGENGATWIHTPEAVCFYRRSVPGHRKAKKADPARAVGEALSAIMPAIGAASASAAREASRAAVEAISAANKQVSEVVAVLKEVLSREASRVDSAITEQADRAKGTQPQGSKASDLLGWIQLGRDVKNMFGPN